MSKPIDNVDEALSNFLDGKIENVTGKRLKNLIEGKKITHTVEKVLIKRKKKMLKQQKNKDHAHEPSVIKKILAKDDKDITESEIIDLRLEKLRNSSVRVNKKMKMLFMLNKKQRRNL